MTDDQKARRVATERDLDVITQTTPQLVGWLIYSGRLLDGDYRQVVREHADMCRPLAPHLDEAYNMALRARIRVQT